MTFLNEGYAHINGNYNDVQGDQYNKLFNMFFNIQTAADILAPSASRRAAFNATPRQPCSADTRVKLLNEIKEWVMTPSTSKPIYWLYGAAGLGKTAIAQTIAEECVKRGSLGASFFFSKSDKERNDVQKLFPTIAYQLCLISKEHDWRMRCVLDKERDAVFRLPEAQLDKLIIEPLKEFNEYQIVIIDSLDECDDYDALETILPLLVKAASETHLRFLITSRLTSFIATLFKEHIDDIQPIDLYHYDARNDIRIFYRISLKKLGETRSLGEDWFTDKDLDQLVDGSGNLFLYATTVASFISSARQHNPRSQLKAALTVDPGQAGGIYGRLDALYRGILSQIPDEAYRSLTSRVIGTVCLAQHPLTPVAVDDLLGLGSGDTWQCLQDLHAFFQVPETADDDQRCIHLAHSFFREFIMIPARSTLHVINPEAHHSYLLCKCLDMMTARLKRNILDLPVNGDRSTTQSDQLISERLEKNIRRSLAYACHSWHYHLKNGILTEDIFQRLELFTERAIFYWTEFMSASMRLDEVLPILKALLNLPNLPKLLIQRVKHFDEVVTQDLALIRIWPLNIYRQIEPPRPVPVPVAKVVDVRPTTVAPLRPHTPESPPIYPPTPELQPPMRTPPVLEETSIKFPEPCILSEAAPNADVQSLSDSLRNCELLSPPVPHQEAYHQEAYFDQGHAYGPFSEETTCAFCMQDSGNVIIRCISMADDPVTICEDCLLGPLQHGQTFQLFWRSSNQYFEPELKPYTPVCGQCNKRLARKAKWMHCIGCEHEPELDLCLGCYRKRGPGYVECEFIPCVPSLSIVEAMER